MNREILCEVVFARDITEKKKTEKELTEARIFAELATAIAKEALSKAKDAVKATQQFLSNMSHEIRTSMNAIIGFSKITPKTDRSVKQRECLNAIKINGDNLIVLINDIFDLAKVEAGKITFEEIPFRLASSISSILHLFETKIQEKNLELLIEYDKKIPEVLVGDLVRLHQIILNLVKNAVKFTTRGTIRVSADLLDEDDEKVKVKFSISDTRIGIQENKISNIFDNFQQTTTGTSQLYGGTGLGLVILNQLVEQQGGTTNVESKVDEGSTFSFSLNFKKTRVEAQDVNELMEIETEIKNTKILVVEDIALNQFLMKTMLDNFSFEFDITANGKLAIEKLKQKSYDIILIDLQMPEINGNETNEYIRNVIHSTMPIIALTANVTIVDLAKCRAVGKNDYIAKPMDERQLYNKILSLVQTASMLNIIEEIENEEIIKMKYIDLKYLSNLTKSNQKLMSEMISLYLEQTPPLIYSMKQSLKNKDWSLLQASVHKMIPSFSIMGISADYEHMAKKIQEFASTQEETDGISEMVLKIENVCTQACQELEVELLKIRNNQ
jgi:hypothetical protein